MVDVRKSFPRSFTLTAVAVMAAIGTAACLVPMTASEQPRGAEAKPATPSQPADERAADRTAVLAAIESMTKDFSKGDAKTLVAHWTDEGEYIDGEGEVIRGRAALEKAYGEFLSKNKDHRVAFEPGEVRFPSRDTAIAEGHMKLRRGKSAELTVAKANILLAREDGQWRVVVLKEFDGDGRSVRDLEFLVGTWSAKGDQGEVRTTYEWAGHKTFLRCRFSINMDGKNYTGTQMIGKDPETDNLKVWTFEDDGGVGESVMRREGKRWVQEARAALQNGSILTATNILTPVDADTFSWHSVSRELDDSALPDLPPVKVTRVKGNQ